MSFAAVAIECNEEASAVVRAAFRNVQTIKNAEDFQAEAMSQVIQSGRFSMVLVMGGSPCQQVSRLNPSRAGLRSAESLLFRRVPRVASEFSEVISNSGLSIPVLCILENVEYASADFAGEVAKCMSGPPLVVHGGSFGYVRRSRCFWISDGVRGIHSMPALKPPLHTQVCRDPHGRRKKPWPEQAPWKGGFAPCFNPCEVALGASQAQVLPVFTRAFEHPEDQLHCLDEDTVERFRVDGRRFPAYTYKSACLLWKGNKCRQPDSTERARIMGVPPSVLDHVAPKSKADKRESINAVWWATGSTSPRQ